METNKVMEEVLGDTPDLSVSDLYNAEFKTTFRGYDKQRVRGFLARVADAFEVLERDVTLLREANETLKSDIARFREMEGSLTEALAGAQQLSEATIAQANREADLIRKEAEVARSVTLVESATIPDALREEIAALRTTRARLKADMRAILDIHAALLSDDEGAHNDSMEFMPQQDAYGSKNEQNSDELPDSDEEGDPS